MRGLMLGLLGVSAAPVAHAAEVVFLSEDISPEARAAIERAAGAERSGLQATDLLAASGQALALDRAPYESLEQALKEVRAYETRLDGELIIMQDLGRALDDVAYVGSTADRDMLFAALTYQGFAVHRFFEDTLGDDPRGADHRTELNGLVYVKPWAHALAIEPEREISPYEVAEAPQRIAYTQQTTRYGTEVLPGTLLVDDKGWFEQGGSLVVDGRPVSGTDHKLLPGMHWAHVVVDGRVLDAHSFTVSPGQTTAWTLPQAPNAWRTWIRSVEVGQSAPPDAAVKADVRALGGEVWFVYEGKKGPQINALAVSSDGEAAWRTVEAPTTGGRSPSDTDDDGGLSFAVGLGGGWVYSGDFYTQDPVNVDHDVGSVNAVSTDLDIHAAYDVGTFRAAVGVHTALTLGEDHVALTGSTETRVRPYIYAAAGLPWVQMSLGYLMPYHLALGPQVTLPVWEGLELRGSLIVGLPGSMQRDEAPPYETQPYSSATVGVAWRFR